jgi:heme exporter protein A
MQGALLAAEGLACARGGVPVLAGVHLAVAPGEALVLTGPNGAGKTTLLRTLAGIQPPAAGRIAAPAEGVAYAGHLDAVKPTLTVAENLRFWAAVHGSGDAAAALAALDLAPLADRAGRELSAGQRRRLGLARLLVAGRRLWLMDEPTVSLDGPTAARVAALIGAHLAAGGAAVIATHIPLGLAAARTLDLAPFRARPAAAFGEGVA